MDELELLADDEVVTAEYASQPPPTSTYRGSLDYIDSLPTESPLSVKYGLLKDGRNTAVISNALSDDDTFDQALPRRTRLLTDNRRWNPTTTFDPGTLTKGASRVVSLEPRKNFDDIRDKRNRRVWERLNPSVPKSKSFSNQVMFDNPFRVSICVKRKIRREVMHALGLSGYFRRSRRFNPFSRVHC